MPMCLKCLQVDHWRRARHECDIACGARCRQSQIYVPHCDYDAAGEDLRVCGRIEVPATGILHSCAADVPHKIETTYVVTEEGVMNNFDKDYVEYESLSTSSSPRSTRFVR